MSESMLSKLFSFRMSSFCGFLIALYVFSLRTEMRPLSFFLYNPMLYVVTSAVALVIRLLIWIAMDRGTFYEFPRQFKNALEDCVLINVVLLCTLSFLFLFTSFLKS